MKTATKLEDLGGWAGGMGTTYLYHLSEPWNGHLHVALTVIPTDTGWHNAGWQAVGTDHRGVVPGDTVESLAQGYQVDTHANILAALGWTVKESA